MIFEDYFFAILLNVFRTSLNLCRKNALVNFWLFHVGYGLGWGCIPNSYVLDILPPKGFGVYNCYNWLFQIVVSSLIMLLRLNGQNTNLEMGGN
jgi:hypothetical protein